MTIKTLYTNGCSWTADNSIARDVDFKRPLANQDTSLMNFAWPKFLGDNIGANVINDSTGGGSNYRIVRCTIDFIMSLPVEKRKETLVVIGWTLPDRNEIYLDDGKTGKGEWFKFNNGQPFSTFDEVDKLGKGRVRQVDEYQQTYIYISDIYSGNASVDIFFQQIYLLKNLLENIEIPFLFFMALPWHWEHNALVEKQEKTEQIVNEINRGQNVMDIRTSMLDFMHNNKLPMSTCIHPLPSSHRVWAQHITEQLRARLIIGE